MINKLGSDPLEESILNNKIDINFLNEIKYSKDFGKD